MEPERAAVKKVRKKFVEFLHKTAQTNEIKAMQNTYNIQ
jgi:hypothetical protein